MSLAFRTRPSLKALALTAIASTLSGCSLGTLQLSGPLTASPVTVETHITGSTHGGQQPVAYTAIHLYAVGATGYGSTATDLTTQFTSTTNLYYPGGATGCNATPAAVTAYSADGAGNLTLTAPNSLRVGMLAIVNDANSGQSGNTLLVTAATPTTFTVSAPTSTTVAAGTDSGTATPVCYNYPTTDVTGSFTITGQFSCGANTNSIVYLTATGGNPGLATPVATNPQLALSSLLQTSTGTAALKCSQLNNSISVQINELTTAAMGIAMGQYFTTNLTAGNDSFGAPNTTQAQVGLTNAAATALTLVNTSTGVANVSTNLVNGSFSVKVAPESTKLSTIADILAACVNSSGGTAATSTSCGTLLSSIEPTGATTAPSDTIQAAALFGTNPNPTPANSTLLWNLVPTTPPFPALSTQPADWTVGILYTDTNPSCTAAVTGTVGTCALQDPQVIAPDSSGNLWVMNHNASVTSSLTELSPVGAPIVTVNTIAAKDLTINNPRGIAIDTNDNVWLGMTTAGALIQYNVATPASSAAFTTSYSPYGPAIDGSNNVFYGSNSTSAKWSAQQVVGGDLTKVVQYPAFCVGTAPGQTAYTACSPTTNYGTMATYAAVDTNGIVWFGNSNSAGTGTNIPTSLTTLSSYSFTCAFVSGTACQGGVSGNTVSQTFAQSVASTGNIPALTKSSGMAAGASGVMWVTNGGASTGPAGSYTVVKFTNPTTGTAFGSTTTVGIPQAVAVDGAGTAWIMNALSTAHSVSQLSSNGTFLSPTNTGTAPFNTIGYQHSQIVTPLWISIDPSGNVWLANNTATTGGVFEIVGAAAPTVTPLALALKNGTVGTRP
jgi:hypothetical protein